MMAVNSETSTPSARVTEKPFTMLAPNVLPKTNRIKQVMSVEVFEFADGRPGPAPAQVNGLLQGAAGAQFLLQALEDQHVGVHRHADAQDEACNARQCQDNRDQLEEHQRDQRITMSARSAMIPGRR